MYLKKLFYFFYFVFIGYYRIYRLMFYESQVTGFLVKYTRTPSSLFQRNCLRSVTVTTTVEWIHVKFIVSCILYR